MAKILKVTKRNGSEVLFTEAKIKGAIKKAYFAVYEYANRDTLSFKIEVATSKVILKLEKISFKSKYPTVEDIQDIIEDVLLENDKQVFKAYSLYRSKHEDKRKEGIIVDNVKSLFDNYIGLNDWKTKENANMAYSLQGLNNYVISEITENYWLNNVYTKAISNAHTSGDMKLHDLGLFAPYCCGWSLEQLLQEGFGGVAGKPEFSPAKHFKSAFGQAVNFLYTMQGESAGAQAFSNVDTYLSPFIREDGLSYTELRQAMQEVVCNCNISTRVGFQTPFINWTLDIKVPSNLENQPVLIGGEPQMDKVYGDYQYELNMFNQAFAEVMLEGDSKGRQFSFPIPTYNLTKDFDWENPVLDTIMEMTAKYGIPSFCNYINSDLDPEDATSMCCRLRLDRRKLRKRGGGLFGSAPMTGSIGVVTINMSRIGYLSETETEYFSRLEHLMDLARESLRIKREIIEENTEKGLYPYAKHYLRHGHARFGFYWSNHFSTIGLNGMNESIMNFFGKDVTIGVEEGKAFAERVLDFMNDIMKEYQEQDTDIMYNLEATPAEGTGYKLALQDKALYPDIITSGENEPYYTNSTQLPVNYTNDIFEALDLQEKLQTKYTGGTTFHAYLGERISDVQTCKALVRKIAENYAIPYFTISPTYSICPEHGYIVGEHFNCPICGKDAEVWARVVGFNRPVQQMNKGKVEEFKERKTFLVEKITEKETEKVAV